MTLRFPSRTTDTTLLVFGSSGQVASELALQKMPPGWRMMRLTRQEVDLRNSLKIQAAIAENTPAAVINAAAYTAVDKAERDQEIARIVNARAPTIMAEACAKLNIPFLHISTDYIFRGDKVTAYCEEDATGPLGAYGASKLAGEKNIRQACSSHLILRTSWVFSRHGNNFVKTMLRLAGERDEVRMVVDQHGGPTSAANLAETLVRLAGALIRRPEGFGTFHYSGAPTTTWHGFAAAIFAELARRGHRTPKLIPITTDQYPTPARRPANSVLDCTKLASVHGILQPSWPEALNTCLSDLLAETNRHAPEK